jgi:hypothetical protein
MGRIRGVGRLGSCRVFLPGRRACAGRDHATATPACAYVSHADNLTIGSNFCQAPVAKDPFCQAQAGAGASSWMKVWDLNLRATKINKTDATSIKPV